MKAVVIDDEKNLHWEDFETPEPGADEVLIKVHATAINRADLIQRQGFYPPPPGASPIMGLECSGEIAAVGKNATRFKVGDRVCALLSGGGYAEFAAVHEGSVLPIPGEESFIHGACLPEVFATAWLNLFMEARLQPGEKVILHAGASGVGTAAIQLCRSFGSPCFVTVGDDAKIDACVELGAESGFNRHQGSFLAKAKEFADEGGIDVILDPVGGAYLADNLSLLGLNGRLVLIGLMGGNKAEIDLAALMMKRLRVIGSTLRARPVAEKEEVMSQLYKQVWPKIESGEIKPIVDTVFPIEQVEDAHKLVSSDATIGKVVLSVT
ncbi:MAG: NAD(P)H-quinone oxidoreductase [Proteobacteria bacterium]|nr:NAD(P)H-quinone oxidoreductase [Pseudomonadota bacterium]MCH8077007.1 NAD(P)H-quinone oxidoreductase [SAR324 cluster bacterium]